MSCTDVHMCERERQRARVHEWHFLQYLRRGKTNIFLVEWTLFTIIIKLFSFKSIKRTVAWAIALFVSVPFSHNYGYVRMCATAYGFQLRCVSFTHSLTFGRLHLRFWFGINWTFNLSSLRSFYYISLPVAVLCSGSGRGAAVCCHYHRYMFGSSYRARLSHATSHTQTQYIPIFLF